jgi:hypothetical protein
MSTPRGSQGWDGRSDSWQAAGRGLDANGGKRAVTEPVPAMDPVMDWLASKRPEPKRVAMLHQDYKFDNVMFAPRDPSRMSAVPRLGNGHRGRSARRPGPHRSPTGPSPRPRRWPDGGERRVVNRERMIERLR